MKLLAVDPGNVESAYCLIETETCRPLMFDKILNHDLRDIIGGLGAEQVYIESISSYGMAVGASVFDTCVWVGRFIETVMRETEPSVTPELVKRNPIKVHHCHSSKAKDSNVIQALVDRFAYGEPNHGKGTVAKPGWFFGFSKDRWQAYALAVYAADTMEE